MRPFARKLLLFLILGVLFGEYLHLNLLLFILFFSLILLLPTRFYPLYLILSLLFGLNYKISRPNFPKELFGQKFSLKGEVKEKRSGYWLFEVHSIVNKNKEIKHAGKVNLLGKKKAPLQPGDFLFVEGILKPLNYPTNPNIFNQNRYLKREGIGAWLYAQEIEILRKKRLPFPSQLVFSFREYAQRTFNRYLKGEGRKIILGLLFGEKEDLSPKIKGYFAKAGVYHILAVSGLHIGILALSLLLFLSVLRLKNLAKIIVITLSLLFYLAVVGFSPSATRATIMFLLILSSYLIQRKADSFHSLVIAAILIILFSPSAIFQIGFQLSFIITAFILLFASRIHRIFHKWQRKDFLNKFLFLPLSISSASFLGAFPLTWFHFYQIPIILIFANLFVIPLVGFILPLSLLILLLNLILPPLAQFLSVSLDFTLQLLQAGVKFFGNQPFSSLNLAKPSLFFLLWIYSLILLPLKFSERRLRKLWLFLFLGGLTLSLWSHLIKREEVRIVFLDTYRSEPIVIEARDKTFLILTGKWNFILDNFLLSKGINKLDILFLPKINQGELRNILKRSNWLKIKNIFIPKTDSLSSPEILKKVDRSYEIIHSGINLRLLPEKSSYNILLRVNHHKILFYFAGEEKEALLMKIDGGLRRKRIEEIIKRRNAQYFILQNSRFHPEGDSLILNTAFSGAIEVKIGREINWSIHQK